MTNVVPYHVGPDNRYSLEFINPDREEFKEHLATRTTEDGASFKSRKLRIETDDGVNTLYAVYCSTVPDSYLEEESDDEVRMILDDVFTEDQLQVLRVIMEVFTGITEAVEKEGGQLMIYKDMDLENIPEILEYPDWGTAPIPVVGGQLLSKFILKHPLPNANHRTAIGLLERYLRSHTKEVSIPDTGKQGTWYEWAAPYIHDSKRLLTLRRNARVFRYAREFGVDVVRRKNEVHIDFHDFDLSVADPWQHFSSEHEAASIDFVRKILQRSDASVDRIAASDDPGWEKFVMALRSND